MTEPDDQGVQRGTEAAGQRAPDPASPSAQSSPTAPVGPDPGPPLPGRVSGPHGAELDVHELAPWHRTYWRRPLVLLVAALLAIAVSGLPLSGVGSALAAGRAMDDQRLCARHPDPCLVPVAGWLHGPHRTSRGVANDWWLVGDDGGLLLDFQMPPGNDLVHGHRAVAYQLRSHDLVAAVVTGGRTSRTAESGFPGALQRVAIGSSALLVGALTAGWAWTGWRQSRSVVAVISTPLSGTPLPRPVRRVLVPLGALAACVLPAAIGVRWSHGLAVLAALVAGLLLYRRFHRSRGRHARRAQRSGR